MRVLTGRLNCCIVFLNILSGLYTPVATGISGQKPLAYHIPADGAEIVVEVGDDDIHFPLRIDAVIFERVGNDLQNDALLLSLRSRARTAEKRTPAALS